MSSWQRPCAIPCITCTSTVIRVQDCGFKTHHTRDGIPLVGTLSNNLPGFDFQPQVHLYCKSAPADRLQAYAGDGSTKFVDMPKEFGGSGEQMTC